MRTAAVFACAAAGWFCDGCRDIVGIDDTTQSECIRNSDCGQARKCENFVCIVDCTAPGAPCDGGATPSEEEAASDAGQDWTDESGDDPAPFDGGADSGADSGKDVVNDAGPVTIADSAGRHDVQPEAAVSLCSTGCAVAIAPLSGDGQTDQPNNNNNVQSSSFAVGQRPMVNMVGARVTFVLCVAEGEHAMLRTWVQNTTTYWPYSGPDGNYDVSLLRCASGMHSISYVIMTSSGFDGFVGRWGITVQASGSSFVYHTVQVKIDSVTYDNVAEGGISTSYDFAPGATGAYNMQTFAADSSLWSCPIGTTSWTAD